MSINTKRSYTEVLVSGTPRSDFTITFEFNEQTDGLQVLLDGVDSTPTHTFTLINPTTVRLNPAIGVGVTVRVLRETDIDQNKHKFTAGAEFNAANMDANFEQVRHSQQEVRDEFQRLADKTYPLVGGLEQAVADAAASAATSSASASASAASAAQAQAVANEFEDALSLIDGQDQWNANTSQQLQLRYTKVEVDNLLSVKVSYTDMVSNLAGKANKATTINGYNITDAYTKAEVDTKVATVSGGYFKSFATKVELLAATGMTVGQVAKVMADPVTANNGDYFYQAVTGWTKGYDSLTDSKNYTDTKFNERFADPESSVYSHAVADYNGNVAMAITLDGIVVAQRANIPTFVSKTITAEAVSASKALSTDSLAIDVAESSDVAYAVADALGNMAITVGIDGRVTIPKLVTGAGSSTSRTLSIGNDDSIMHIGDSMTASHYCLPNKSYVSLLAQLSDFRHINYGVSGEEALDMQKRILNDTAVFSSSLKASKPKYLFITTYTNDGAARADLKYFQENIKRMIDVALGHGVLPVIVGYWNMETSADHQALKVVADEYKCPTIWCDVLNRQIGQYASAPVLFNEPHTGTRTNGLWWIPMYEFVRKLKAMRTIKMYRKRASFTASTIDDLLYQGVVDKGNKWQEVGVGHYSLADNRAYKYDELNTLVAGDKIWALRADEYVNLQNGIGLPITDYGLLEVTLDAYPQHLQSISITVPVTGTGTFYVRNNLDPAKVVNRVNSVNDAAYQAVWDKPRGSWLAVTPSNGVITIDKNAIANCMVGNRLSLLVVGAVTVTAFKVTYQATKYQNTPEYPVAIKQHYSDELLAQPLVDSTRLGGWTIVGSVPTLVPIDYPFVPRKVNVNTPVDGVCVLNGANSIAQTVTLVPKDYMRTFRIVAWARVFPKAYLDRTVAAYSSLDANQIVDRSVGGNLPPITKDTFEVANLQAETWVGSYPITKGAYNTGIVGLMWSPVEFIVECQPFDTSLTVRFSAPNTEIQFARASITEIL